MDSFDRQKTENLIGLPELLQEPVSIDGAAKLGTDICSALEHLRRNSTSYLCIKPDNIFYNTETDRFILGDSCLQEPQKPTVAISDIGAALFSAPETLKTGDAYQWDIRSGLYSLGLVMYMILNDNLLPFVDKPGLGSAREAQTRRLGGEPLPFPSRAQKNMPLANIVMKACAYSPEDRYESALQMKDAVNLAMTESNIKDAEKGAKQPPDNFPKLSDDAYRIEAEIGSGGGGVVYKAWHKRLQKYVVIKELKQGAVNDLETQRNEVEALKNVKSAYLPQVLDFLTEGGRVYTVMDFIEGMSIDKLLEQGHKFSQPQVVKWYAQLASALETIHKQNVCHRDVKPANVMLTPDGNVCLIDFNAALVGGNDIRLISRSLGYASPEQYEIYDSYKKARGGVLNLSGEFDSGEQGDCSPPLADSEGIDWKRSDIYSLGATMYHLLTGMRPPEKPEEVIPLPKLGGYGEGVIYVIDKSMQLIPAERFATGAILADGIRKIHKFDTQWKIAQTKMITAAVILPLAFTIFAGTSIFGRRVMAQEKEERYYEAVYDIKNGSDPQEAYETALSMFWDRIAPYRAMAERLWDSGDIDACKSYIERNLGNIAEFQAVPKEERSFGDIYYILGNCYYFQPGAPDYNAARESFEISVRFVNDNPVYFRDYAISLARTGNAAEAEQVLKKAQSLNLEADSLDLLKGEISFTKREYDNALEGFGRVILLTDDDYIRYRAYHTADEIYTILGQPENSVALLSDALDRIPLSRVPEMTERLADAYVKNGEFENAITLFGQLAITGAPQFHIMHSLAILLHNTGEFDRAEYILAQMSDMFPNDYRVPMRQAFLEADRQSVVNREDRDYSLTKQYYDRAVDLYVTNNKPGESVPEMQQLELLIVQLRDNGWIG